MDSLVSHQELVAVARRATATNISAVLQQHQECKRWHANRVREHAKRAEQNESVVFG